MNDKSNLVLLMFKDSWLLYLLRNSFRDFKIVSGEQLYNCIWLQSRGPNVIEFQVPKNEPGYLVSSENLSFSRAFGRHRPQPSTCVTMTISFREPGTPK